VKLNRLYSNQPDIFTPISFNDGLSAVLAEIRVPANRDLDTHNLGKTTVGELIDFCLLRGKKRTFFLFKHEAKFAEFTFFLEIELPDGEFLTIGRSVVPGSKVDFKRSEHSIEDVLTLASSDWDHLGLPFDRAKLLLNGMLGFEALRPWGIRNIVGYLIRSQRDYVDVFQLSKFAGKHSEWKPFVAQLVGMDAVPVQALYDKREEVSSASDHLKSIAQEWGDDDADPSVLDGLISVKRRDVEAKSNTLTSFNFGEEDTRSIAELIEVTESRIGELNEESYRLSRLVQRIEDSLADQKIIFSTTDAELLFREAGVIFGDQLKKDFDDLIAFNLAITEERREALQRQLEENRRRSTEIELQLLELNRQRAASLESMRETKSLFKMRELSRELAILQAELTTLENRREAAARLLELKRQFRILTEECGQLETEVEEQIERISGDENSRFGRLRRFFTEIIYEVLGQNALIAIKINSQGGLDFLAEFIGVSGTATSGDRGTSYKKLLCIAFDLALLRTYLDVPFPRFVYHDGALEQLEPRKREKLIGVLRKYSELGLQPVISLLDSDLPAELGSNPETLMEEDVVLTLHDEGQDGRLFKMDTW